MPRPRKSRTEGLGFVFSGTGCSLELENHYSALGCQPVFGVDEAGRGPLAGPVVAAAAWLPSNFSHAVLTDSKKLSAKQRESIYEELKQQSAVKLAWALATAEEIDTLNILRATHLAMRRAVEKLGVLPGMVLIDGLPVPAFPHPQHAVVKGDSLCLSIAAASVVAKVERDRIMENAALEFPQYGFAKHKGYGTSAHLAAISKHRPCPLHRRTFAPISEMLSQPTLGLQFE